jgi:hypothetical protein
MALYMIVFLGSTPIGGPLIGWVSEHVGPRFGLGIGAVACLVGAASVAVVLMRRRDSYGAAGHLTAREAGPLAA